jgi:Cu/Ag efflux protein CusF
MTKYLTMKLIATLACATAFFIATLQGAHAAAHALPAAELAQMSEGEIRKVDKKAKEVTIKLGDIKNLFMPPMTMVFDVKDPRMLARVKVGDKIHFVAEKIDGRYTVTRMEARK